MISAHHHSPIFILATKGVFFLSVAILLLMGLLWSVAYCTIGELGTRHLCEYFGARGFEPLIVLALIGLAWPLMVRIADLVGPIAASWAASGRGTGKIAGLTAHDSAA